MSCTSTCIPLSILLSHVLYHRNIALSCSHSTIYIGLQLMHVTKVFVKTILLWCIILGTSITCVGCAFTNWHLVLFRQDTRRMLYYFNAFVKVFPYFCGTFAFQWHPIDTCSSWQAHLIAPAIIYSTLHIITCMPMFITARLCSLKHAWGLLHNAGISLDLLQIVSGTILPDWEHWKTT